MQHLLAIQRSSASIRLERSDSSLATSTISTQNEHRPREAKSAPYKDTSCIVLLETLGNSYMHDSGQKMTDVSMALCRSLLLTKYPIPRDTLFRDDVFPIACQYLQDKNEARIIQNIAWLLVSSPESLAALAALGAKHFDVLTESVNEGWDNCIPITSTRPSA